MRYVIIAFEGINEKEGRCVSPTSLLLYLVLPLAFSPLLFLFSFLFLFFTMSSGFLKLALLCEELLQDALDAFMQEGAILSQGDGLLIENAVIAGAAHKLHDGKKQKVA